MNYTLLFSTSFKKQFDELLKTAQKQLKEKLLLLKEHPTRNKRLVHAGFLLFRIRMQDNNKDLRIVYLLKDNVVWVLCILNRKNDYKDLEKELQEF